MSDLKRKREDEDEDALGGLMGAYASSDESEEEPCDERGSQERPSHQVMEPNLASGGTDDAKEEEQAAGGNCSAEENDDGNGWRNELPFELREPPLGSPSDQVVKKCEKMLQLKAQGRNFNDSLRQHKGYRNPDLLMKLVSNFGVDQYGSAFGPSTLKPEDRIQSLLEQNERELERRARERLQLYSTQEGLMSLKSEKGIDFQRGQQHQKGQGEQRGGNTGAGALLAAQQVLQASQAARNATQQHHQRKNK